MHEGDREETIFLSLLALPPEEREKHLAEACGTDAELQRRVEGLLNAHEDRGQFLDSPVPEGAGFCEGLTATIFEKPGDRIGRYKLIEQIGEGGCGVVYVAEQTEPSGVVWRSR